jgi:hypothetical protein
MLKNLKPGDDVLLHDRKGRTLPVTVVEVIPHSPRLGHVPSVWVFIPALETCQVVSAWYLGAA